jgi:hypothetical protein
MFWRVLFRVIASLLLVAALIAAVGVVGWAAYNSGLAQGVQQGKLLPGSPSAGTAPVPLYAYGPFWTPFFGWAYGLLGCLVPLLVLFFIFSLIRMIFWGGIYGHRHHRWEEREAREHWHEGCRGPRRWREMAEDWHRQQHSGETGSAPSSEPKSQ